MVVRVTSCHLYQGRKLGEYVTNGGGSSWNVPATMAFLPPFHNVLCLFPLSVLSIPQNPQMPMYDTEEKKSQINGTGSLYCGRRNKYKAVSPAPGLECKHSVFNSLVCEMVE